MQSILGYYDVANEITLGFDYDYLLEEKDPEARKFRTNVYGRLLDSGRNLQWKICP